MRERGVAVKRLKPRLFVRRLITSLAPLIVTIVLLGTLACVITMNFVKSEIDSRNATLLDRDMQQVQSLFDDIESVNINFGISPEITLNLKRIMNTPEPTLADMQQIDILKNLLSAPAYSKPDIQSIYVYFNNSLGRFLSTDTDNTLTTLRQAAGSDAADSGWYESYLKNRAAGTNWYEVRSVRLHSFGSPAVLLSVYKNIYQSGFSTSTGVIVLNIRMDYITKLLSSMRSYSGQRILLLSADRQTIADSGSGRLEASELRRLPRQGESVLEKLGGQWCIVSDSFDSKYRMTVVSAIPVGKLYEVPIRLLELTAVLLLLTLAFGVVFSYRTARDDYHQIRTIISIIDNAGTGRLLPPLKPRRSDEYTYIIKNIVKTFVEKDYLKVQLSEKMYREKAMELLALQSQINPHFLFNTLETIYLKVLGLTGGHNEVNTMLEHLSNILQYSLSRDKKPVTLQDEIENAKSYVAIQKIRYRSSFRLRWDIRGDMDRFTIVKLVLQPLIENAISYSAGQKTVDIKVRVRVRAETVKIAVIDNGIGISAEKLMQLKSSLAQEADTTAHVGLYNTHKRIRLAYGEGYGLKLRSKFGFGTSVSITIPQIAPACGPDVPRERVAAQSAET